MIELNRNNALASEVGFQYYGHVLISSISAKVPLIDAVKEAVKRVSKEIKVIGADINPECVGRYFVDEFWLLPKIADLDVEVFINECLNRRISLIIPTRDGELEFFSANKSKFKSVGIHVMVSDITSVRKCMDKLSFSDLKMENCDFISAYLDINELDSERYVVKERFGAGSFFVGINLSRDQSLAHSKNLVNPIFQKFIKGEEISVDCYVDSNHKIKGMVLRTRTFVLNGESVITKTIENSSIEKNLMNVVSELDLYGHIVLQVLLDERNAIHIIECNTRFGGASTLAIKVGLDSFYWAYLESMGIDLSNHLFVKSPASMKQVRYSKDMYI